MLVTACQCDSLAFAPTRRGRALIVRGREEPSQSTKNMQNLLLSVPQAARVLGVGRSTVYEKIASGAIRSVKIGSRRLVPTENIEAFVASLGEGN